ncbi:hypothetical protein, partial [Actinomadura sp. 6K520]|uniref:hypothetical protein n=1 Tax=Actinomadura sp. 6K520 TaxID=2530364 RepID=UPI001A9E8FFA
QPVVEPVPLAHEQVDGADDRAPHVVLRLHVRLVADPDGTGVVAYSQPHGRSEISTYEAFPTVVAGL